MIELALSKIRMVRGQSLRARLGGSQVDENELLLLEGARAAFNGNE